MNKKKRWICLAAAGLCLFAAPGQAQAALSDYDAETAARLQDDKLEYDELEKLVKEYNPQIRDAYYQLQLAKDEAASTAREVRESNDQIQGQLDQLKDQRKQLDGVPGMDQQKAMLDEAIGSMNEAMKVLKGIPGSYIKGNDKSVDQQKKLVDTQVRVVAQQLQGVMITYDGLRDQQSILIKVEELQKAALEAAQLQKSQGMGTDVDVLSAQSSLLSTEAALGTLTNAMEDIRSALCLATGWPADATPEIGDVPAPDVAAAAAIDLQADTVKAIGNNQTLINQRHSNSGRSSSAVEQRKMTMEEAEQKLTIEMQRLYQDIQAKKLSYDAAMTAYESASLSWRGAQIKYEQRMISQLQYLGLEVQFVQAGGTKAAAENALFQAINTYDWAVQGFVKIPD